jgi:Xaa-Pro aminopeptidase
MCIESAADLAGMERAGRVTRAVLNAMRDAVRPGITTAELDQIGSWEGAQRPGWFTGSRARAALASTTKSCMEFPVVAGLRLAI